MGLDSSRAGLQAAKRHGSISDATATGSVLTLDDDLNPYWPAPPVPPEQGRPTSGALPTTTFSSGTGKQVAASRDVTLFTHFASDGTANAASCAIALSPDGTTYSTVATPAVSAAVNTVGAVTLPIVVPIPAGWYVKFTEAHGTLSTATYA